MNTRLYHRLPLFLLGLILLFSGCAYYNTFYNAKHYYKQASKERKERLRTQIVELSPEERERLKRQGQYNALDNTRPTGKEMQNYQRAIEKASKVLEFYPDSRWVDDALVLLGKCFYYRRDYNRAERKFIELLNNFPDSDFVPETRLLLAKTYVGLEEYDEAQNRLRRIVQSEDLPKRVREEASYELGSLYYEKGNYELAASEYQVSANEADDKLIRAMSMYRLGECLIQLKDYEKAPEVFSRAVDLSPNEDFKSQATYKLGEAQSLKGQYQEAIDTFSDLLSKEVNAKRIPMIKLQLAENLRKNGQLIEAVDWYNAIIEDHKSTDASARSYFALAEIEEYINQDYEQANEYYELVRREFANSAVTPKAKDRADAIETLLTLQEDIARLEGRSVADSGNGEGAEESESREPQRDDAPIDLSPDGMWVNYAGRDRPPPESLDLLTPDDRERLIANQTRAMAAGDSSAADPARVDSLLNARQSASQEKNKKLVLAQKKLALGELLLFKFEKPDSAIKLYLNVIDANQDSITSARALYSMAYTFNQVVKDTMVADSLYRTLIELYPETPQADGARKILDLPVRPSSEDSARWAFLDAEKFAFEQNEPREAISHYQQVIQEYPETNYAPKAYYSIGWLYDQKLSDLDAAYDTFKTLVETYEESRFAKEVKAKIKAVDQAREEERKRQQAIADSLAQLEAQQDSVQVDSTVADSLHTQKSVANADSLPPAPEVSPAVADSIPGGSPSKPKQSEPAQMASGRASSSDTTRTPPPDSSRVTGETAEPTPAKAPEKRVLPSRP
jgi:TolA-binding protein